MGHTPFYFESWYNVERTVTLSVVGFAALFVMLRISGKRTLSKLNVFDFVFVVAVGSVFASMIISKDVTLIEGIAALATLIGIQMLLSKTTGPSRSPGCRRSLEIPASWTLKTPIRTATPEGTLRLSWIVHRCLSRSARNLSARFRAPEARKQDCCVRATLWEMSGQIRRFPRSLSTITLATYGSPTCPA